MSLIRRSEFPELSWVRREMDRLAGTLRPSELFGDGDGNRAGMWSPAVDIAEDENTITIKADLPEVEKKDIKVTVENGILCIRGERQREKEEKNKNYHRVERSFGSYERSFSLPDSIDPAKIDAQAKNGVLTVTLPKKAEAKAQLKAQQVDVK